jgi:putative transcriptional regulator
LTVYGKDEQENINAATLKRLAKLTCEVKMTQRDIGAEILTGLEEILAWEQGEIELKTTELKLPTARDVARIRECMGVSQQVFATFMGVSIETLRHWEKGQREPRSSARALLLVADKQPKALRKAFQMGLQSN